MEFGQWLNSLTWLDHIIILLIFIIASYLALLSIAGFKQIMQSAQKKNPYLGQIRTTPFLFFGFAIPYTILLYKLLGNIITQYLITIF
jgi:L-cystine uptake protein TcyP (sodium:dicarboxylate symporter family)